MFFPATVVDDDPLMVKISGSSTFAPASLLASNYIPQLNDEVAVAVFGSGLIVVGKVA